MFSLKMILYYQNNLNDEIKIKINKINKTSYIHVVLSYTQYYCHYADKEINCTHKIRNQISSVFPFHILIVINIIAKQLIKHKIFGYE